MGGMKKEVFEGPIAVNTKGVGFFDLPVDKEGKKADRKDSMEIQPENLGRAFPGDIVEIQRLGKKIKNREQGKVIKIIKRNRDEFVGPLEKEGDHTEVIPDTRRV